MRCNRYLAEREKENEQGRMERGKWGKLGAEGGLEKPNQLYVRGRELAVSCMCYELFNLVSTRAVAAYYTNYTHCMP